MSNSLLPHRLQQARLPCPSLSPRVCSNSCPCPTHESVMPSNHLILCRPLLLPPSIFPSIRVFSSESALRIRWPKYWSFSFNVSHSNEYPGLISFRMDSFDLLGVQGTLKSLLQDRNYKVLSILLQTPLPSRLPHDTEQSSLCWTASRSLLVLHVKYSSVSMSIPNSLKIPFPPFQFHFNVCKSDKGWPHCSMNFRGTFSY